ncbi:hypothetical protein [Kiloniella sp. b19]|uniref:hypothetical protein n=1 Tax=Kiloniella sp. GXU_MW_B19 TaxID=3141326 RepID=UPI0031E47C7A
MSSALSPFGLCLRGGVSLESLTAKEKDELGLDPQSLSLLTDEERLDFRSLVLVGNGGRHFLWEAFQDGLRDNPALKESPDPLDDWTRSVLVPLTSWLGGAFSHPSDGPPYMPFLRWARAFSPQGERLSVSPMGWTLHPRWGSWQAYRGVLFLPFVPEGMPDCPKNREQEGEICLRCETRPCLQACPVNAFDWKQSEDGSISGLLDIPRCKSFLVSPEGQQGDCVQSGCLPRRVCPYASEEAQPHEQSRFHLQSFLGAH